VSALIAVRARDAQPGDKLDLSTLTVDAVTTGANGQTYLVCKSGAGAPMVLERDPDETVSVRR
jgi:hypothetical protein